MVKMQFSKIKDLREDHDLTQAKLARLLDVKRSTYTMWELGDVNFPIEKLVSLACIFRTNLEYLLDLSHDRRERFYPEKISYQDVGRNLKFYRIKLKKTQKEFAETLHIRQSSYCYYEDGKTRIPIDKLVKLAQTYHISINDLCGGTVIQPIPML